MCRETSCSEERRKPAFQKIPAFVLLTFSVRGQHWNIRSDGGFYIPSLFLSFSYFPLFKRAGRCTGIGLHTDKHVCCYFFSCFWDLAQFFYPKRRQLFLNMTALVEEGIHFRFLTWVMGLIFFIQSRSKFKIIMKHDYIVTKSFLLIYIPIILLKLILFHILYSAE